MVAETSLSPYSQIATFTCLVFRFLSYFQNEQDELSLRKILIFIINDKISIASTFQIELKEKENNRGGNNKFNASA